MAEALRCVDRWGRTVILYEDIWYDKILNDHAELSEDPRTIERVVRDPMRVNFDANHANGENFYRGGVLPHPFDREYLKVVVRYQEVAGELVGVVVSAYSVPRVHKRGERHKWSK